MMSVVGEVVLVVDVVVVVVVVVPVVVVPVVVVVVVCARDLRSVAMPTKAISIKTTDAEMIARFRVRDTDMRMLLF
jgi:hypothetical protein